MIPVTSPPGALSVIENGLQIFLALYRELATDEIMKKANRKFNEGLDLLEVYHTFMTQEQIQKISAMRQRVDAARPSDCTGPSSFRNLIRNPFSKFISARKFRKICEGYKELVETISQAARADRYSVFTSREEDGSTLQTFTPVAKTPHANGIRIFVTQEMAREIERAAGLGGEMTTEFRNLRVSVGASTSVTLPFTSSGSVTVALALIQDPSRTQRKDTPVLVLAASGVSTQAEEPARADNTPCHTMPQLNASGRDSSVILLSGNATISPLQKVRGDLNRADGKQKKADVANEAAIYPEDSGDKVAYMLRLDNLVFHVEVDVTYLSCDTVVEVSK